MNEGLFPNIVDKWFLSLLEKFEGFGVLLFIFLTLVISGVLSALIGLERYRKGENAGMRTHALLAIGCSLLMSISVFGIRMSVPGIDYDGARIAAAAVTGIGFLGAGVIIKDRFTVKGLSTATTLWICSAIGLACGVGYILEAVIATIVTYAFIFVRNRIIVKVDRDAPHVVIKCKKDYPALERIKAIGDANHLNIKSLEISNITDEFIELKAFFPYHTNPYLMDYFMNELKKQEEILSTEKVMKKPLKTFDDTHES